MRTTAIAMALLVLLVAGWPEVAAASADDDAAGDPSGYDDDNGGGDEGDAGPATGDLELAAARSTVRGPAIGAVLAAAYAAAGLDGNPGRGWVRRARLAGLIPWVTVRTARDASWQDDQSEVGRGTSLEVRATWRLDRLLFDGRELQVATIESARRRERGRLATQVIRAYFAWRRVAAATDDARARLRVAEAVAALDALTEGWFSSELERLGARPARRGGTKR